MIMTETERQQLLTAIADYIRDADVAHYFSDDSIVEESERKLASFFGVPMYDDGSGYNWRLFETKK